MYVSKLQGFHFMAFPLICFSAVASTDCVLWPLAELSAGVGDITRIAMQLSELRITIMYRTLIHPFISNRQLY